MTQDGTEFLVVCCAGRRGSAFSSALDALAVRDPQDMVSMEAIKALAGAHPPTMIDLPSASEGKRCDKLTVN